MGKEDNDGKDNDLKKVLDILESKTFKFIFYFILIGVIIIFTASIIDHEKNPYHMVANAVNTFMSIVVGIVAMVMSIISLFFSFYNTKQSYDTHNDYLEKFININNSLDQTIKRQEEYVQSLNKVSDKLQSIDSNMSSRFDTMYEMLNSIKGAHFNELEAKHDEWDKKNEDGWTESNDKTRDKQKDKSKEKQDAE